MTTELDRVRLRRWRKRGFYSETVLVKLLQKKGYNAVRVPVSNPSLNPLPDIMARKGAHSYAFEVKTPATTPTFLNNKSTNYSGFSTSLSPQTTLTSMLSLQHTWANDGFSKKSAGLIGKKINFQTKSESSRGTEETSTSIQPTVNKARNIPQHILSLIVKIFC